MEKLFYQLVCGLIWLFLMVVCILVAWGFFTIVYAVWRLLR